MRILLWVFMSAGIAAQAGAAKLNVVFILVDDWGWADAGVQGSDFFETPNIDRLAREGMRFTQAYAAAAICSPTRAAILTGKSPARLDMTIWHEGAVRGGSKNKRMLEAKAEANLPLAEVTLAELFKKQNYFTAHIGKWHLGKAAFYPETQGYDVNIGGTYWGAPATFHWPYRGPWSKNDPELRYVPVGSGKPGDYLTDQLTDHALRIIAQQKDRPFFLSLWFHTVHTPIEGKPTWVKRFEKKPSGKIHSHAEYAAMLASLDENIGRVLRQLDDLKLADRTVVILTSDNGGVDFPTAKSGNRPPTRNAPFRSGKGTLYEGGLRVPLIIRWPGRTHAGFLPHPRRRPRPNQRPP
jgi:arylsulfatase A-like enzyme